MLASDWWQPTSNIPGLLLQLLTLWWSRWQPPHSALERPAVWADGRHQPSYLSPPIVPNASPGPGGRPVLAPPALLSFSS